MQTHRQHMGKTIEVKPRHNPNVEVPTWPIKRLPASDNVLVLSNIGRLDGTSVGSFHDRLCRCRGCKPSLAGDAR